MYFFCLKQARSVGAKGFADLPTGLIKIRKSFDPTGQVCPKVFVDYGPCCNQFLLGFIRSTMIFLAIRVISIAIVITRRFISFIGDWTNMPKRNSKRTVSGAKFIAGIVIPMIVGNFFRSETPLKIADRKTESSSKPS